MSLSSHLRVQFILWLPQRLDVCLQVQRLEDWIQPGDQHLCLYGSSLLFQLLVCYLCIKLSQTEDLVDVDDPVCGLLTGYCTYWTLLTGHFLVS